MLRAATVTGCVYVEEYLIGYVERDAAGDDQAARFKAANKIPIVMRIFSEFMRRMENN
jgi:hypothetical protein